MFSAPVITPSEVAYIQSVYPLLEIKQPSSQLNHALMYYLKGYSPAKAAAAAGYKSSAELTRFIKSEEGQVILEFIRDNCMEQIVVTRELLNSMLFDAHATAANSTEKVAAIRELGKLNDLYPGTKIRTDVNIDVGIDNLSQLGRMTTEQLMHLAPGTLAALLQPPEPIDSYVLDKELDVYDDTPVPPEPEPDNPQP